MATYKNLTKNSAIASIELSPMPEGNVAYIHLSDKADRDPFVHLNQDQSKERIKEWLTLPETGQQIIAEARMNGHTVLITRGNKTKDEMLAALKARGDTLREPGHKREFRPWVWRGNLSNVGQILQFFSSKYSSAGIDGPVMTFAVSNLLANVVNISFGAEENKDKHHLLFLKESFNKKLAGYLPEGSSELPSVKDKRAILRKDPEPPKSVFDKFRDFMKRHSVSIGEIGLRYFGALSLIFPIKQDVMKDGVKTGIRNMSHWKKGLGELTQGSLKTGFKTLANPDVFTQKAGIAYVAGKSIALLSKAPDPFNPKPHTWWDTFREKISFRLSSMTEFVAALVIVYDRLLRKIPDKEKGGLKLAREITFPGKFIIPSLRKVKTRDWLGGIGGMVFASGFIIRMFAPFGVKSVDMEELDAHITDGLAKVPRNKLPQLLAETTASIKEHFGDKVPEFGQIYTQLTADLYRYHHISLPTLDPSAITTMDAEAAAPAIGTQPETKTKSFASDNLKKSPNPAAIPRPSSHQDRAAGSAEAAALGV